MMASPAADFTELVKSSETWNSTTDAALFDELQKLSAWMLDSFTTTEQSVGSLLGQQSTLNRQLSQAQADLQRLSHTRAVIQVEEEVDRLQRLADLPSV